MLNVREKIYRDDSIIHSEFIRVTPYTNSYDNSAEIRLAINQKDLNLSLSDSFLLFHVSLTKEDGTFFVSADKKPVIVNNGILHSLESVSLEINNREIDSSRNVGVSSTLKGLASFSPDQMPTLENASWTKDLKLNEYNGMVSYAVPLKFFLGFCEDYKKIISHSSCELILYRNRDDKSIVVIPDATVKYKFTIIRIEWYVKSLVLSVDATREMLKIINSKIPISIPFRTWRMYENPIIGGGKSHKWHVKTTLTSSQPRYIIFGFQTNRKNNDLLNSSIFDNCKISKFHLFINEKQYPKIDNTIDFTQNNFSELFQRYIDFQKLYYEKENSSVLLSPKEFVNNTIFIFNTPYANESIGISSCDVTVEFESSENIPENTILHCLLISDKIVRNIPLISEIFIDQ
jgi:hypothetical protein